MLLAYECIEYFVIFEEKNSNQPTFIKSRINKIQFFNPLNNFESFRIYKLGRTNFDIITLLPAVNQLQSVRI